MSDKTTIRMDRQPSWNPVTGCGNVSPGYDHCYAGRL